ncbi:hypothetical protein KM043_005680 [Ampulex compressa]|nr:hypothetical protein KM043_005680 [Ampulex compressa]
MSVSYEITIALCTYPCQSRGAFGCAADPLEAAEDIVKIQGRWRAPCPSPSRKYFRHRFVGKSPCRRRIRLSYSGRSYCGHAITCESTRPLRLSSIEENTYACQC